MNDHGTVEIVLAARRLIVLQRLTLGLVIMVGVLYLPEGRDLLRSPIEAGFLLLVLAYAMYLPVRMLVTGVAIVITDRGLIDRTSGLGFMAWNEIRSAHLQPFLGLKLIAFDLTDVETVIARLPPLRRWNWRLYLKMFGAKPTLAASFVEGGPEALLKRINDRATGGPEPPPQLTHGWEG